MWKHTFSIDETFSENKILLLIVVVILAREVTGIRSVLHLLYQEAKIFYENRLNYWNCHRTINDIKKKIPKIVQLELNVVEILQITSAEASPKQSTAWFLRWACFICTTELWFLSSLRHPYASEGSVSTWNTTRTRSDLVCVPIHRKDW